MADTLSEVVEQAVICPSGTTLANLATGQDFTYRIPREIMKFVLANLLRGAMKSNTFPRVELVSGSEHNEVRIVSTLDREPTTLKIISPGGRSRCALWAFGGELLSATDNSLSTTTLTVCLPKA